MSFYDDASWLLIPSGIKEDVVFAQKPTSGLGDLTFTRASDATYTDASGVVRRSPYNLLTWSEMFSDVAWTKRSATISANVINAPNGTLTADKIVEAASTGFHSILQTNASRVGVPYTFSVYLKAAERTWALVWFDAEPAGAYVNLSTGELGTVSSGVTASVTSVGDGWYRCIISKNIVNAVQVAVYTATSNGGASYVGNGTSGIFAWGAQLVEGTSALDYFPTTNRQDVPRIDFRNADGTLSSCGRLLLEPQRTNLLLRSEEFDNAAWGKFVTTLTANAEISPGGTQDAETMTVSTSDSRVEQTMTLTAGTYIFSVYVKVISQTTAGQMRLQSFVDGANVNLNFTPTTQWQRVTATYTAAASLTSVKVRGQTFVGTLAVWGAQLEAGAYPTTYIPTTTAAVTRIADAASKTGVSSLIGQTQGTVFFDANFDDNNTVNFSISDGTSSNYILIDTSSLRAVGLIIQQGGVTQAQITTANSFYTSGTRLKCAIAYKQNDFAFYINGTLIGTDSSGTVPACGQIRFSRWNGALPAAQGINQAAIFTTRLTNSQLQSITTL